MNREADVMAAFAGIIAEKVAAEQKTPTLVQQPRHYLYRIAEAAAELGISRTKCYAMLRDGLLPSVVIAGVRRIPSDKLHEWIQEQYEAQRKVGAA